MQLHAAVDPDRTIIGLVGSTGYLIAAVLMALATFSFVLPRDLEGDRSR